MGRRSYKKVTVNGEVTLHQRYIYRGYLQFGNLEKLAKWQFVGVASRRRAEFCKPRSAGRKTISPRQATQWRSLGVG